MNDADSLLDSIAGLIKIQKARRRRKPRVINFETDSEQTKDSARSETKIEIPNGIEDVQDKIGENIDNQLSEIFNDIISLRDEIKNERRNSKIVSAGAALGASVSISKPAPSPTRKYLTKAVAIGLKLLLMIIGSIIGYALCTVLLYVTTLQPSS